MCEVKLRLSTVAIEPCSFGTLQPSVSVIATVTTAHANANLLHCAELRGHCS